jgi:ubiquinone/menaquinone biosynthesis C-methylase UbiE
MIQKEAVEYLKVYREHPEWWLQYLRRTREKEKTAEILTSIILNSVLPREKINILDVGAGDGTISIRLNRNLADEFSQVLCTLVEPSHGLIRETQKKVAGEGLHGKFHIINAPWEEVSIPARFHVVFAVNSFYGMNLAITPHPLDRMIQHTSPGGLIILVAQSKEGTYRKVQRKFFKVQDSVPPVNVDLIKEWLTQRNLHWEEKEFVSILDLKELQYSTDIPEILRPLISLILKEPVQKASPERRRQILSILRQYFVEHEGKTGLSIINKVLQLTDE